MSESDSGNREKTCCGSFFTFLLTTGFIILIYWAIFQPHHIRATVDSATLSNLAVSNATSSAAVSYHLAISLNLYNPSLRVNIYYDTLHAELRFRGTFLSLANTTSPTEFYQHRKCGDDVKVEFDGSGVGSPGDVAAELEKEKDQGVVGLEVTVDARVRYRFGSIKIRQKPKIWCSLTIPVKAEGRGGGVGGALASGERCSVKY